MSSRISSASFALSALALFAACTVHVSDRGSAPAGEKAIGYPQVSSENVTDTRDCLIGGNASALGSRWEVDRQSGAFTSHSIYDFRGGSLRLTNRCEFMGHSISASVTVPFVDDGSSFRTLRGNTQTEYDFDMDCTASIAAARARYWFRGSCLVVQDEASGETLTMIPAKFW